ncbi:MAG: class I SAM-dependent methyltransferase [Vulcanimicrobiaceae bacterium]
MSLQTHGSPTANGPASDHSHTHMWLVGLLGLAAGLALLVYVPHLKAVAGAILLFAGFHIVGGIVVLASLYVMGAGAIVRRWVKRPPNAFDFGWAPGWTHGPWIAALIFASAAVAVQVAEPAFWPLAMLLMLSAASFFAGSLITRSSARYDYALLPMVDLFSSGDDVVLDAGCGAGRTTVAIGRALRRGQIVSLDRFDADYIDGGGRALLEQNLRIASLTNRVRIERGDLTALPFAEDTFDSVVSTNAIDHLGARIEWGLREVSRVLKHDGRFLLAVWVPSWAMFAVANVLSFSLKSRRWWRNRVASCGFELLDEGYFNGAWFMLLQKRKVDRTAEGT